MDYTTMDEELAKLAQVQAILYHIVKYHLPNFDERMQREVKQATLDIADLRPKLIKYMAHYFADQEMSRIKKEVEEKTEQLKIESNL
jgi:hypothetical protein